MRCQHCGYLDSKVIDSRPTEEGSAIRRRRECLHCGRRFTTYEKIETSPVMIVKKDMRREAFNPDKIKRGILHACQKRPVSVTDVDAIVENASIRAHFVEEVCDVLMYLNDVLLCFGITPEEVEAAYEAKHARTMKRW